MAQTSDTRAQNRRRARNANQSAGVPSQLPFGPKTAMVGAAALIAYGLSRRSKTGTALAAAGGLLAYKSAKGRSVSHGETEAIFLVNASPEAAYKLWRNFEGLPRFMAHLKSVRMLDDRRSEWVALGPGQREISWVADITEDAPGRRIAWKSDPGSSVIQTSGYVEFRPDPLGRGTYVTAHVEYGLPGGQVARGFAAIAGKHPEFVVREDVRRFKALLESGEVPTTLGQSHGPRGIHGKTEQMLFREQSNQPEPQAAREYRKTA